MTRKRLFVAVVVAAALIAAGVTGAKLALPKMNDTKALCAEFTDAVGLYPGNKVQLLGIEVGGVTAVTNKPDFVQVDFTVPKDLDLPADVGAVTYSQSIVTDRHVELTKPYSGGPKFTGSQCIKLESTKTPLGISETFAAADKLVDNLLDAPPGTDPSKSPGAQAINDTLRVVSRSLEGTGTELNQTLRDLVTIIGDPHLADAHTRELVDNGELLTSSLLQNWGNVATALVTLPGSLAMIEGLADGFGSALHDLAHALPILVDALNRFAPRVYHNITDKLIPWLRDILNAYTPNIVGTINSWSQFSNWVTDTVPPSWGTHNVPYLPPQVAVSPPQVSAICSVLRERKTPGSEAACAPGTASDPVTLGLTDLILGNALS
ncbi:MCE family protein [Mycobacterium intermedium]|uniref:MCE family protein n=1 Tax=Mycobacterium intermedium TaxID=28445 RepID=A0A1E3SEP2_MYCIE|nr:MlaD family protein [Mycobacterium intermedium]MCV6965473.1 MCE family protein [Mycobacterium intermedium]ODR00601.1 mammalian cell entry protein [Mycobacterium intermedium]OPE51526.1 MCE family protein [Mycobacterium intermedium]ORB05748.1 MCE family protein [Mycobacterium intermedium]